MADIKNIRAMIYGSPGAGKTTLALTFPKPMFVFDFDGGLPEHVQFGKNGVEGIRISDIDPKRGALAELAYTKFRDNWYQLIKGTKKAADGQPFKSVMVDTASGLQDSILNYYRRANDWWDGKYSMPLYGALGSDMTIFGNEMRIADFHVIVTAYDMTDKDELTGEVFGGPNLAGNKFVPKFLGAFSDIWYMKPKVSAGKAEYITHLLPYGRFPAKNRRSLDKDEQPVPVFTSGEQAAFSYAKIIKATDELRVKLGI